MAMASLPRAKAPPSRSRREITSPRRPYPCAVPARPTALARARPSNRRSADEDADLAAQLMGAGPPPTARKESTDEWVRAVVDELTDAGKFGTRGEGWFAAQVVALLLVALPPAGLREVVDAVGACVAVLGGALVVAGSLDLATNLTPLPRPRDNSELVTAGAYSIVRHPMYAGLALLSLGAALAAGDEARLAAAGLVFAVLNAKADVEEGFLEERYGAAYREYRGRVKKLIPFLF